MAGERYETKMESIECPNCGTFFKKELEVRTMHSVTCGVCEHEFEHYVGEPDETMH